MDPFFDNFFNHAGFGPPMAQREVPEARLQHYRGRLPEQLLAYWQRDGWCGWGQGLLWTVDPEAWRENLATWLAGTPFAGQDEYHVIARTAFGKLIVWGKHAGQCLKIDTAWGMLFPRFDAEAYAQRGEDRSLQLFFSSQSKDSLDENDAHGQPLFERALARLGPLDHDQLYGFTPALALGGSPNLNKLQRVEAHTHLDVLAQLTERQIMRDIGAEARDL